MTTAQFLLPRSGESDEERRLREALETQAAKFLHILDSAIRLRDAPSEAQRTRHRVKAMLQDACLNATHAHQQATQLPQKKPGRA